MAVLIPAWQEAAVIGATISHMLRAWPQGDYRLFIGCYGNDPATLAAAARAAGGDGRVRLVIHDRAGPTTKADCLNRLYRALAQDEARTRRPYRGVLLHDAEDMVHPLALAVIDQALETADFVQLPVRPEFPPGPRWVSGHYCDEFVESHAKAMVVRSALGAGLPAAGVGCAFSRVMLEKVAHERGAGGNPFAAECLTEDYELGLLIARLKGRSRFLRLRDGSGQLIGTRSYFPATLPAAVRQKTRWIHGISLQSWERLGWSRGLADIWMALRDRRGPLTALVLTCAYVLMLIEAGMLLASLFVPTPMLRYSPAVLGLMRLGLAGFFWRAAMRFAFSAREYGLVEGCFAVLRIPVANVITIMAGRRAFVAYCRSLRGMRVAWEKTVHINHPADHPVRLLRQMAPPAAGLGQAA